MFVHDHVFYTDGEGCYYTSGKLPYSVWERYLSVFEQITVVARAKKLTNLDDVSKLNLSSGLNVSFVEMPSLSNPKNIVTKRQQVIKKMKEIILENDAVIARVPSELGLLAAKIALKVNKPWAVEVVAHAWDALWNYGNIQGKIYAPILYWRTREIVKKSKFSLYVTKKFLQSKYPSYGYQINCSNVELPNVPEEVLVQRLQREVSDKYTIGLIGSLNSNYKGIDTALKAIQLIRNIVPNIELRILGDGSKDLWLNLASNLDVLQNVRFDGVLPGGDAVFNWLDNLDLYIHPSRQEGLPRALIEAMSRGLPALGSTVAGIPELLEEQCLHSPNDYKKLANLIECSLDINWREEQSRKNFLTAKDYTKEVLDNRRRLFLEELRGFASTLKSNR